MILLSLAAFKTVAVIFFIEATRLPACVLLRFSQSLGRNLFRGTKKKSENLS